jgi:L-lactate dehydrogenase complex protein LldG
MIMKDSEQIKFIGRVREALGCNIKSDRTWAALDQNIDQDRIDTLLAKISGRSRRDRLALLDSLTSRCQLSNISIRTGESPADAAQFIVQLVQEKRLETGKAGGVVVWRHPLLDQLKLEEACAHLDPPLRLYFTADVNSKSDAPVDSKTRARIRRQVVDSTIGVTSVDYCLAESATLVLLTRPGLARSVSLVPPVHVAVISLTDVIANLEELYALLNHAGNKGVANITNCMTFISGRSTTRDIEAVPVPGVHGPGEVNIFVVTGTASSYKSKDPGPEDPALVQPLEGGAL